MELVAFVKLDFVEKRELYSFLSKEKKGGESESPLQKKRPKFLTV